MNEADDQYALMHYIMTPRFDLRGINAAHFEVRHHDGTSMMASYDEIIKVLEISGNAGKFDVYKGSQYPLKYDPDVKYRKGEAFTPPVEYFDNAASRFIIEEALREDERPLFVVCLGAITNVATALLMNPDIAGRFTCVWIGGGSYPDGSNEFNLSQDVPAANLVFGSQLAVWQIPTSAYSMVRVSLAELEYKVRPCGAIGEYLFRQLVELNDFYGNNPSWPDGETWVLGDSASVGVLMGISAEDFCEIAAPLFTRDLKYTPGAGNRKIRVFKRIDARLIMEDFYAKLAMTYR
jgi:inosine-uridine nucleoside N-ribohydrolase